MYYVIDYLTNPSVPDPEEGPFLEIHEEDVEVPGADAWQTGEPFEGAIATPIDIEATPHHGYAGPPQDYFDGAIAFMSPRLLKVLKEQGVDNLDLYPARVRYRTTGEVHEVVAFNLIGLVSAVDHAGSDLESKDGDFKMDTSILGFDVDFSKTRELSLFRLAENCMTVLVHERIKKAVDAAGINTFTFVETKDWAQL